MEQNKSIEYYNNLTDRAKFMNIKSPAAHNTLFCITNNTSTYLNEYFYSQLEPYKEGNLPKPCLNDILCKYCKKFHIENLKNIDKGKDINFGHDLENCFQKFLEDKLNTREDIKIKCERADTQNLHMPDFKIVRKRDNKVIAYFEFKVIFRPYITITKNVDANYRCYSNSLTLDLSNGKKLEEQRKHVENDIGVSKAIYIYWYDIPCVKGVFWMPSKRVYEIMDEQVPYDRNYVPGDFNASGRKIGSTKKLYIPLLETRDLRDLLNYYYKLANTDFA